MNKKNLRKELLNVIYEPVLEFLKKNIDDINIIIIGDVTYYKLRDLGKFLLCEIFDDFISFPIKYKKHIDNKVYVKFESIFYFLTKVSKRENGYLYNFAKDLAEGSLLKWSHNGYVNLLRKFMINEMVITRSYKNVPVMLVCEKNQNYKFFKFYNNFSLDYFMKDTNLSIKDILFCMHIDDKFQIKYSFFKNNDKINYKIDKTCIKLIQWSKEDFLKKILFILN